MKEVFIYDGLRTDFLVRTAEKLGIAINNLLLMEKLGDPSCAPS